MRRDPARVVKGLGVRVADHDDLADRGCASKAATVWASTGARQHPCIAWASRRPRAGRARPRRSRPPWAFSDGSLMRNGQKHSRPESHIENQGFSLNSPRPHYRLARTRNHLAGTCRCWPRWPGSPICRSGGCGVSGRASSCPRWWRARRWCRPSPRVRERAELGFGEAAPPCNSPVARPIGWPRPRASSKRQGARIIDINMGCPAKKVTVGAVGLGADARPRPCAGLIEAVVGAVDVPVTLKTRLGWDDDCLNAAELARRARGGGHRDDHHPRPHALPVLQGTCRLGAIRAVKRRRVDPGDRQWRHHDGPTARKALAPRAPMA
jgi:hypothetical protein